MSGLNVAPTYASRDNYGMRVQAYQRAMTAWNDLNEGTQDGRKLRIDGAVFRNNPFENGPAHVWPMSQAYAAALNISALNGDYSGAEAIDGVLQRYQHSRPTGTSGTWTTAYQPDIDNGPGHDRFTDDNMALGLNYIQAYEQTGDSSKLEKAKQIFPFLEAMVDPGKSLNWKEGTTAYVSDSLAGAQKFALLLAQYDPAQSDRYVKFAWQLNQFVENRLRDNDPSSSKYGLVLDNVESQNETSNWKNEIFSYNQGWSIGSDIEWYKYTGNTGFLDRARQTADKTLAYYRKTENGDGLWKQPPSFNANFFENLLALEALYPHQEYPTYYEDTLRSYLDRAWQSREQAVNRGDDSFFHHDGIGSFNSYGKDRVDMIDQAGMVQMYALLAMSPQQRARVR